ncbi:MAG: DoxX family protein [Bdellovibrionota bacterium]
MGHECIGVFVYGCGQCQREVFDWDGKEEMFNHLGFSLDLMFKIGFVEVLVALLYVIPGRIGFFGTLLLTAYLGGAVVTHVRVGDPFFFPIIVGAFAWTGYVLRDAEFRNYIICCRKES